MCSARYTSLNILAFSRVVHKGCGPRELMKIQQQIPLPQSGNRNDKRYFFRRRPLVVFRVAGRQPGKKNVIVTCMPAGKVKLSPESQLEHRRSNSSTGVGAP